VHVQGPPTKLAWNYCGSTAEHGKHAVQQQTDSFQSIKSSFSDTQQPQGWQHSNCDCRCRAHIRLLRQTQSQLWTSKPGRCCVPKLRDLSGCSKLQMLFTTGIIAVPPPAMSCIQCTASNNHRMCFQVLAVVWQSEQTQDTLPFFVIYAALFQVCCRKALLASCGQPLPIPRGGLVSCSYRQVVLVSGFKPGT
jgi:hypothetical protein